MTAPRKSNRSQSQSTKQRDKQHLVLRFVAILVIAFLAAGTAVYFLAVPADPFPPPAEQVDDSPNPAAVTGDAQTGDSPNLPTAAPVHDWQSSEFVGSQVCADCHLEIAEAFAEHPMANTLATVADATSIEVLEDNRVEFATHGRRYRVERDGDRVVHTEYMTDADGNIVYEQPVDVHYAIGSGENARSYLIDRGGLLFESPVTWYTDKQKWDLSPGYHNNPRQRFNRRVIDGCVQCHSGHVNPLGDGTSNRFGDPPFQELGIGCERCHGPGKRHVEKYEAEDWDADSETADKMLIVNPAHLERGLKDSVCYQCHMKGKRRILRKGKSFHDFRPGMATDDVWTTFVPPAPFEKDGTAQFSSHVEQMHSSACFVGSDGAMSCTTCHDPHRSPKPDQRAAFYRERCNKCHSEHGCSVPLEEREMPPALNSCVHCHMPSVGSNVPHTSQSDHRILRNPSSLQAEAQPSTRGEVWSIFGDSEQHLPAWEIQRARAIALSDQAIEEMNQPLMGQAITALESVLAHDRNDVDVLHLLGYLYELIGKHAQAKSYFEAALRIDPQDEMSLKNLGLVGFRTRAIDLGLASYGRYLKVNKWDGTMFSPYVRMLAASGDLRAAAAAAEQGLQLDPTQLELRDITVKLYERLGNQKKSQQHLELLQEINSQLTPWDQKRRDRLQQKVQKSQSANP
ncbi:Tetratricopeptide repeat protein [Symmachiella dynata]|uniref:cytochrome c3 family protein n=1 Tax=Symmachiella dynata TaxID=2527995 RepID=UPI00118B4902|nr:cytochrome c3 family protein [Symmachiella dynata]QDT48668.1 Tetratricopeptide repeat protein [Symmachiella dynata]